MLSLEWCKKLKDAGWPQSEPTVGDDDILEVFACPTAEQLDAAIVAWMRKHLNRWHDYRVTIGQTCQNGRFSPLMAKCDIDGPDDFDLPRSEDEDFVAARAAMWIKLQDKNDAS